MARMQRSLIQDGYDVYSIAYPTTALPVEKLAADYLHPAVLACASNNPRRIHFVAHSLGGIVVRQYLSDHKLERLGRIVMLGTPNQGSEVVDKLGHMKLFKRINGPAGSQLGTGPDSLPYRLPTPDADIGIIAGTRSINWILSCLIPGDDDGKVSPESAKLAGMKDYAEVATSHPFLMRDDEVIEMTKAFLATGRFAGKTPES